VLPKHGGGTVTVQIQNGKVASVSQSSITLKSTDGYTRTYAVTGSTIVDAQRDGIGSVKSGNQVWIVGVVNGGSVTAVRVRDESLLKAASGGARLGRQTAAGNAAATWPSERVTSFSGSSASG